MSHQQFPCGQCGAKLSFAPGTANLKCEYCGFANPIPQSEADIEELDFEKFVRSGQDQAGTVEAITLRCETCSAQVTLPQHTVAQQCPFCGSNVVSAGSSQRLLKPKSLLPFAITKEQARVSFSKWIKSRWFAPSALKKYARADHGLDGVYLPYWTYDTDTTSYYTGRRGEYYYVNESYTTVENGKTVHRTRRVRKTRWHSTAGVVWNRFDDILVVASESLPRPYLERLEPWDLEKLIPYTADYLSGFRAESYQVDLGNGFKTATQIIEPAIRQSVRQDIGGDEQEIDSLKTGYKQIRFKHILLPIWISAYRFGNKTFRFLVNARTGEIFGERPYSKLKILLAILAGLGVAALTYYFYQ